MKSQQYFIKQVNLKAAQLALNKSKADGVGFTLGHLPANLLNELSRKNAPLYSSAVTVSSSQVEKLLASQLTIEQIHQLMSAIQNPSAFAYTGNQIKLTHQGFMITIELGKHINTVVAAEKI